MSWRIAASLIQLRRQLDIIAPNRSKLSDGSIGDAKHAARKSDHNPNERGVVTAIDITHDPKGGLNCHDLALDLLNSRDPRIKYVIWDARTFSADIAPLWQWRKYNGENLHRHHLHISVNLKGEDDSSIWRFIGGNNQAQVIASALNVREAPLGKIIDTIPRWSLVEILPEPEGWVRIKLRDGREGYVAEKFISRMKL
jgi:hypothetical protein